jgi:hypothetical protein
MYKEAGGAVQGARGGAGEAWRRHTHTHTHAHTHTHTHTHRELAEERGKLADDLARRREESRQIK